MNIFCSRWSEQVSGRATMAHGSASESQGMSFAILHMWQAVRRHAKLFGSCFAAVFVLGMLSMLMLKPVYTATATVALSTQVADPLAPSGQQQADQFEDDDLPTTVAAMMQSRDVAAAVLAEIPPVKASPRSFAARVLCRLTLDALCAASASADPLIVQQSAIDDFLKRLAVTPEPHSRIIDVGVTAATGPLAEALTNAVVVNYQRISLSQQSAQSDHVANWLETRTQDLQQRWLTAVQAADTYGSANDITDAGDGAATVPLVVQRLSDVAMRLEQAQSALIDVRAAGSAGRGAASEPQSAASATADLLPQLETARAQLAGEFGPNYPKVKALDNQIEAAQIEATRSAPGYGAAPNAGGLRAARDRVDALTLQLNQLTLQATAEGVVQANYLTLKAEADNAHTAYATFVEHAAEVADRATLLEPAVTSVSTAGLPLHPSFPDKPKLALGVVLLSLLAGAAAAMIKENWTGGLINTGASPAGAETALLVALPYVPARRNRMIAHHILDDPYSRTSEAMRGIANSLALRGVGLGTGVDRGRCILIASAGPLEGRTTVASWLASTVRQTGESVLLISADHCQPAPSDNKTLPMQLGFTDIVFGSASLADVIQTDPVTKLDTISAGSIAGRMFECDDLNRLSALIARLKRSYTLVVVDSPPLLAMTDAFALSKVADETIFICRWQHTSPRAVTACIDRLRAQGALIASIVVSMVNKNANLEFDGEYSGRELAFVTRLYGA